MSVNWRTIDIDQYDEDAYTEDEILAEFESGLTPEQVTLLLKHEAQTFVIYSQGDLNSALTRALEEPPYGRHSENAKIESTKTHRTTRCLMKYLYAGMGKPEQFNSSVLLTWHEKLTEVAGNGSIVRVMTDKRTVF
ncbi:unnamed protein product [Mucor hiemalis]